MNSHKGNENGNSGENCTLHLPEDFGEWMQLADFYAKRHDQRRNFEWKITLGFWAAIFGSSYKHFSLHNFAFEYWPLALLFFTAFWLYGTWFANHQDKKKWVFAIRSATCTTSDGSREKDGRNPFTTKESCWSLDAIGEFLLDWARLFQILATASIMWIAWGTPSCKWGDVVLATVVVAIPFVIGLVVGYVQGRKAGKATEDK